MISTLGVDNPEGPSPGEGKWLEGDVLQLSPVGMLLTSGLNFSPGIPDNRLV